MRRVPPRRIPLVKPLSGCLALALAAGAGADANTLDVLLAPHGWPQRRPAGILCSSDIVRGMLGEGGPPASEVGR